MSDSDDEPLTLSSHALAALAEFNAEKEALQKRFVQLRDVIVNEHAQGQILSMDAFAEDWGESQFWNSEDTAKTLAEALLEDADATSCIAVVSAPSVFVALKNALNTLPATATKPKKIVLLEHDRRFAVFSEFVYYDFAEPFKLPAELKGSFDRIICDPPFLSQDCQTKTALTTRWLSTPTTPRVIVCTGERMEELLTQKLYRAAGVRTTNYELRYVRGLSNEFYCYANFDRAGVWERKDE